MNRVKFATQQVLEPRPRDVARRTALAGRLATFTDARVERYWMLLGVLNGWPTWEPSVPAVQWWIGALRV